MTLEEAKTLTGGLSHPSKMPGAAYSVPAAACKVGSALREIEGSVCSKCYALRNNYTWPNTQKKMAQRLESINDPQWVDAMSTLIKSDGTEHFRWHDSGDLQSPEHLEKIVEIANRLPKVKFYLPTHERQLVLDRVRTYGDFPKNLVVRLSAAMFDQERPTGYKLTATVHHKKPPIGFRCPAHEQGNKCADCRACWDRRVKNISYERH